MSSMKLYKQPSFGYGASQSNHSKYEHQERHNASQSSHVEHGWAAKPNHSSSYYGQTQGSQMGYDLHEDNLGHSWADDSTHHYVQAQTVLPMPAINVQESQIQEYVTSGAKFSSPARGNYSGGAMASSVEEGWTTKPNPIQTSGYGVSMYKGQEANMFQYGRNDSGCSANGSWANKPISVSGPIHVGQSTQMMYGQHEQQGWANGPNKFSSSAQANHSSVAMRKEEHMVGKTGNGWTSSPLASNHSSQALHKEEHMMAKGGNAWTISPVASNHSSQAMHKEEHIMENMDHSWASGPTNANHSSFAMRQEVHNDVDNGWVASPTKASLSSMSMRKEEHMVEKMDHGWVANPTTKLNHSSQAMMLKEEHKVAQTRNNWAATGSNNSRQGWAGNHSDSFGPAQSNHSAHAAYNYNECHEDEGLDDILDEILTKYPAHNVSDGATSWAGKPNIGMGQSQASSYAKQEAWAQSAHHGGSAQSSMASSNVGKFSMSSDVNNGGIYVDSIGGVGNRSNHEYGDYQGVRNHGYRECDD